MKIPTMGQIVLFHFRLGRSQRLFTRPACVIAAEETGHCDLNVFWGMAEYLDARTDRALRPLVVDVIIAPDGIPFNRTWTFRPEDL
jgi:hypothetical protein